MGNRFGRDYEIVLFLVSRSRRLRLSTSRENVSEMFGNVVARFAVYRTVSSLTTAAPFCLDWSNIENISNTAALFQLKWRPEAPPNTVRNASLGGSKRALNAVRHRQRPVTKLKRTQHRLMTHWRLCVALCSEERFRDKWWVFGELSLINVDVFNCSRRRFVEAFKSYGYESCCFDMA